MSREKRCRMQLSPISQVGLVVKDVDKTVEFYTKIGLGPFDIFEMQPDGFVHSGKPTPHRVKLGFSRGTPQIELIETIEGETTNSRFLKEKGEGITHFQYRVDLDEYDAILTELAKEGAEPIFYRNKPEMRITYLNTDKIGGVMIELVGTQNRDTGIPTQQLESQLPPIDHIGMAVKDVDKTVEYYTKIGLGPFRVFETAVQGVVYRGKEAPHRLKLAVSSSPPMINMTQVLEGESPNADFPQKRGDGVSHLGFRVKDFDKRLAQLAKAGIEPVFHRLDGEAPFAYLNADKIGGVMIELIGEKKE